MTSHEEGNFDLLVEEPQTSKHLEHYHYIKFDFKPASCDMKQNGDLKTDTGNHVSLSIPSKDNDSHSTFNGLRKKSQKEYLLILDRNTNTAVLRKVDENILLKGTRNKIAKSGTHILGSTLSKTADSPKIQPSHIYNAMVISDSSSDDVDQEFNGLFNNMVESSCKSTNEIIQKATNHSLRDELQLSDSSDDST